MPAPIGIHHIQIAIPPGSEETARTFYRDVLGLTEIPIPASVAQTAAAWFENGSFRVHLGVDPNFHPSKKGHPAFVVDDLDALRQRLNAHQVTIAEAAPLPGQKRFHAFDPFGNRLELIELT